MTERTAALSVMISLVAVLTSFMVMNSLVIILVTVMISVIYAHTSNGRIQNSSLSVPLTSIPDASVVSSSPPSPSVPASSSRSWKYDVFLSFRGDDIRKTFVDHLYSALVERVTCTYKDDMTLLRGDTIGPSLFKAIEESQIVIIIFSQNYADSSWCLDELEYIMKCNKERGKIVMPIFYHVDPSDVRKQKTKYGEAFAKHESENNNIKVESWKKALVAAGNIAGWEINHNVNGYEAKCIKDIVGTVLDKLLYLNSDVDETLVGMGTRSQDLKSRLKMESGGVRMVGIWGIGGGGKTTLAYSLYNEIYSRFDTCCFVEDIKEESNMKSLQEKILSTVMKIEVKVESVDKGKQMIKTRLGRKNVLLVLDDIDDRKQLEALAGSNDWFGDGSRIIITTRNEQLLRTHRVDEICHVSLLSDEEAIRLFYRRAYNESKPIEDYKTLSQRVVSYAAGLPLALIVLGSFLYDKNKEEWISTLDRLKDIPEMEIVEILKISYDGLTALEKELFLDIACFWRGREKDKAMEILDACGFHPGIGVKVLIQKALVTISSSHNYRGKHDIFEMHDLVQEMGHHIVRGEHTNNPERHTRLWRDEEVEDICIGNATTENNITEAIKIYRCPSALGKFLSKAKKLRFLYVNNLLDYGDVEAPEYISSNLQYLFWESYPANPFPESFQPRKLVILRLKSSLQKELWRGYKDLPYLKELQLHGAKKLVRTPDFNGLPCLQKLTLYDCISLKEIHPSLGNHTTLVSVYIEFCDKLKEFPTIVQMRKLEILNITSCKAFRKFPEIEANMDGLVNLSMIRVPIKALPSTVGKYCPNLQWLKLKNCYGLKSIEGNFHALKHLHTCKIQGCYAGSIMLPKDLFHEHNHLHELHSPCFLTRLTLSNCELKDGEIPYGIGELSNLQELNLKGNAFSRINFSLSQLTRLKFLNLSYCNKLVELPELPTSIAVLKADDGESLEVDGDIIINRNCKWLCQVSIRYVKGVTGGYRLLEIMLQGNAIENGCMSLQLDGLEIPNGFRPPLLVKGTRCRLELPQNWFNHFSGFLFCFAVRKNYSCKYQKIRMKHEDKGGMDSQKDVVYWEESLDDDDVEATWVGYVSFGLLKRTTWWDTTSTAIEFSVENDISACFVFGVRLVSKTSNPETTTSDSPSAFYKCNFSIDHDSESDLVCKYG